MLVLQAIAILMVVAFPLWDRHEAARLRAAVHPLARSQCYIRSMVVLWLAALAVVALAPPATLWYPPEAMRALTGPLSPDFVQAFVPTIMIGLVAPVAVAYFNTNVRRFMVGQLDAIDYLMPRTRTEIALFAGVSVTAGVCEEILFRGLLFHCLQAAPFSLAPLPTLLVGSALFGLAHMGQGFKGVLVTGAAGLFLGGLYMVTGSLLLPIAVHILIDLRATVLAWLRTLPQPEAA